MNTDALLIVAVMIATTGFGALGVIFWLARRDDREFRRTMEKWDR